MSKMTETGLERIKPREKKRKKKRTINPLEAVKFDKEETGYGSWKVRREVHETGVAPSPPTIPDDDGEEFVDLNSI